MRFPSLPIPTAIFVLSLLLAVKAHAILAGGEFDLPVDKPSLRIDPLTTTSSYNFVGALDISINSSSYIGTGSAMSPNWVLTAAHNVDFNDDGAVDDGLSIVFNLPGYGSYTASSFISNPNFTGFGNPTVHNDLSLLYFADPLPLELSFPILGRSLSLGDPVTLAGFGRSGYGSYGYTTNANLTDRRIGSNVIHSFALESGGDGKIFRYDFDEPATTDLLDGSLGNALETIIGPGDSGGPALLLYGNSLAIVGVNTFVEGYGGRFGDIGGGVALDPYWGWISETTGLALIPEPARAALLLGLLCLLSHSRRYFSK